VIQASLFSEPPERLSTRAADHRRIEGMNRARKHAEREMKSWRLLGMVALEKFLVLRAGQPFLAETFVEWAKQNGVPLPPDGRAWGSVFSSARKLEIIVKVGVGLAATSNLSPKPMWRGTKN
jgi:hypothetical protein